MANIANLLTEHIDIWTAAETEKKSGRGRASGNAGSVYGVKKLRELILELAVRGKLVQQDPNDEPASELLKRIKAEKANSIAEGKLKKEKALQPIGGDEKPFELPKGWDWARLNEIAPQSLIDGDWIESKDQDVNGEIRLIQLADIGVSEFKNVSDRYVNNATFTKLHCYEIKKNDILIARLPSPIGRACIFPGLNTKAITVVDVAVLRTNGILNNQYVVNAINSKTFVDQVESFGKGATRFRISTGNLKELLLPIAPLPEQQRIVAKVGELMALCDQLEQQHSNAQEAHETLVSQLLTTLTQSQNAAEFNANWQRIYVHFDVLFTTEASIEALKQILLQLAVMGKLVPQDPFDEPASELLKRIQAEKAKLILEGKLKKKKPLAPIGEDEKPFEMPKGWEWARFPELGEFARGKSKQRPRNDPSLFNPPIYPLVQTGEVARAGYVIEEFHSKYSEIGLQQSRMWAKGTLCITIAANIADSAILGFDACFPDSVVGFSPSNVINSAKYFLYFMKTARDDLLKFAPATAQKNINLEILESVLIPTPPLAEQHRIVVKVDALMALCDQLKTRIQQANQQQQNIADALLAQAVA